MSEVILGDDSKGVEKRKVGAALGIGILLLPWIFAWFLLRKGYSPVARVISFVWMAIFFLIVMGNGSSSNQPVTASAASTTASAPSAEPAQASASEPESNLTAPQRNAVRSAKQYLRMTGFSRKGLIAQLSSSAGDGYDVADATAAVDSLDVDWNENAVRSAKQYLGMSGFSCKGLIEQLSSSAGDKYTVKEATYGARQAGACS